MTNTIARLNPSDLPNAGQVGYSQISIAEPGRLAFVSGQVAWTADGRAVPGSIAEQTRVVVANLDRALLAIGAGTADIVQMRIYVVDLDPDTQGQAMGPLLAFLDGARPSLTGIGVSALAGPDLKIEIEMVVRLPD